MAAPNPEPQVGAVGSRTGEPAAVQSPVARADVATFPGGTYSAFLALVLAEVAVGAFLGNWLFNEILGGEWVRTLSDCLNANVADPQGTFTCYAGIEQTRAVWSIGGAVVVVGLGLIVMALAPGSIRRRRALRRLGDSHRTVQLRLESESAALGVRRPPELYRGPLRQRDAFSFGAFGRYAIAIPPALVSNANAAVFEGVIRHELAHVRNRDVGFSWLASSIWYVVGPLLVIPGAWGILTLEPSLLPDYLPRAIVIALVVWATSRNLLRVREWEADLTAARASPDKFAAAERTVRLASDSGRRGVRRVLATHPSVASRLEVLHAPARVTVLGFVDTAVVGLLVAFAAPMVEQVSQAGLAGGNPLWALTFSAIVVGAILGTSVGVGIWRNVHAEAAVRLADPGARRSRSRLAAACGLAVGTIVGEALSLRHAGIPIGDWLALTNLLPAVTLGATVAVSASLASAYILGVGRRGALVASILVNIVLFGLAWWLSRTIQTAWGLMGWELFAPNAAVLLGANGGWLAIAFIVMLGAAALVGLAARRSVAPGWWYERSIRPDTTAVPASASIIAVALIGAVAAGLVGVVITFVRWSADESLRASGTAAIDTVILVSAAGAACWSLGAAFALRGDGPAIGVVGGPLVAATTAVGGTAVICIGSGDTDPASVWMLVMGTALVCALPLGALGTLMGAVPGILTRTDALARPGWRAGVPAVAAVAGLLAFGLLLPASVAAVPELPDPGTETPAVEYVYGHAPGFVDAYATLRTAVGSAAAAYPAQADEAVAYLRDQVLPEYRAFAAGLAQITPENPELSDAHTNLVQAVAEMTTAVQARVDSPSNATCVEALTEPTHATQLENEWIDVVMRVADDL